MTGESGTASPGTALVTGAAHRIGRAIALDLARAGWRVAVHYLRSTDAAAEVVGTIQAAGGEAAAIAADLADASESGALVGHAAEALGPVNCLINSASVFEDDTIDSVTPETWSAHLDVNLRAPMMLTQALAAALPAEAPGHIINLIDQRVWNLTPHFHSYTISKAGLWALTQTAALALAPRVRVNGIGPGPTLPSRRQSRRDFSAQVAATPLRYQPGLDEICATVRFIMATPSMTGQMIALDSGQHLAWRAVADGPVPE